MTANLKSSWPDPRKGRPHANSGSARMKWPVRTTIDGAAPKPAKLAHCWNCGNPKGLHPLEGCKTYIA